MRKELVDFANQMESILKENDFKGGWDNMTVHELLERLHEEVLEFEVELDANRPYNAAQEIIDVANFCMMIYDKIVNQKKNGD